MAKLPEHLREFDDTDKTRKLIYSNTMDALKKRFPVEDDDYRLELSDVKTTGPHRFTMEQQKRALMHDRQLRTPVSGKWRLVHKPSKAVLDEREDVIMHIPHYTERGTVIYNGNEYSIVNQSRLKPGAYTRKRRTGETEAHINVRPGTGKSFRIQLEPSTGVFKAAIGQAQVPLYSLMSALGVSDKQLADTWGNDLLEANIKKTRPDSLKKLYRKLSGYKYDPQATPEEQAGFLRDSFPQYEVDEDVIASTLGITGTDKVTPDVLLRTTQKLLNVSKGSESPDDRDAPMYSNIMSIEDLIRERIDKDAGRLSQNLLQRAKRDKNLSRLRRSALDPYIDDKESGLLFGSRLAMPLEETNPLHTLEQLHRITKLGEGGIGSAEAVTEEARDVNSGQYGFIDPIQGPEGMAIGIDTRAAYRTFKGTDKNLYGEFHDPKADKTVYLTPADVHNRVVAFPGQLRKEGDTAAAMVDGEVKRVPKSEVDLEIPTIAHMFGPNINLNPMPTGIQPGRQFYAAKFWGQYLPKKENLGEVPLVSSLMKDGKTTFGEYYGNRIGTLKSPARGTVSRVTKKGITITDDDGKKHFTEIVKNFPFNRLSGISYFPSVKAGDRVMPGDMVAHSNFTDSKTGALNLGTNLKTAIIPARGHSYEDAMVISESASKKMATERLYGYDQNADHGIEIGKNKYVSLFPGKFGKEQMNSIGSDGVVKPGTELKKGDPIILSVGPKMLTSSDAQLGKLHKVLRSAHMDKAVTWDHTWPGTVTDVATAKSGAKVNVKSTPPVQVGDKAATVFGLKGVTGKIIPDEEMPKDAVTNEPYDMLLNPAGVLSRVAPAQVIEIALGKLAKATGKQVRIPQERPPEGWKKWAEKQLKEAGVSDSTTVFDPKTGKHIKNVGDGYTYMPTFHHLAEKKLSARGEQGSYTIDEQPAKGGPTGSKRFSQLDLNAALSHGATEIISDMLNIKGTRNEDYWKALRAGRPLPEPDTPFIYDKFMNTLKAGGINVQQKGDILSLMPMTDNDINILSKGAIKNPKLLTSDFEPEPGGLFDVGLTGGTDGNRWTHIELAEPIPNPVMEEPVRRVLGLKAKELRDVMAGNASINGISGGRGVQKALQGLDVDGLIKHHKDRVMKVRGANRDNSIKILGYLSAMKKQGLHPADWMMSKLPVLPPKFRPVARLGDMPLVADINELYQNVMTVNDAIRDLRKDLPESSIAEEKLNLYDAVTAAVGLGAPITPEGKSRRLKGAIRQVIGTSPKHGMFQNKVISKTVGGVGRGVITPDPSLDMDSVGIPEDSAWEVYKDFVIRRLVRRGYPTLRASEMVEERDPTAKEMLNAEMAARPVILDRAPTWHKFNLMSFYPHIVSDDTIHTSPLITDGFNADYDGDSQLAKVIALVPLTNEKSDKLGDKGGQSDHYDKKLNKILTSANTSTRISSETGNNDVATNKEIDMFSKTTGVPAYDSTTHRLTVIDLEDFPHSELIGSKEGEKGPIDFYRVPKGIKVLSHDEANGSFIWADVAGWSAHKDREVEIVNLKNGAQIVTDDDPRAVYGIPCDGDITAERTTPTDAQTRMFAIPYARHVAHSIAECRVTDTVPCAGWPGDEVRLTSEAGYWQDADKLHLTRDIGYWLGAMAGDGWWNRKYYDTVSKDINWAVHLSDSRGHTADAIDETLKRHLPEIKRQRKEMLKKDLPGRYGDTVKYTWYSKQYGEAICRFLSEHLGGERSETSAGSGAKHLPAFAYNAPRGFREGLLCGLIDTDGTVAVSHGKNAPQLQIAFTSTSLRLCRDVQFLCRTLDIHAAIGFSKLTSKGNKFWIVSLSTVDCKRTGILAGLKVPEKKEKFDTTEVNDSYGIHDMVPYPEAVSKALFEVIPRPRKLTGHMRTLITTAYQSRTRNLISREKATQILEVYRKQRQYNARLCADASACLRGSDSEFTAEDARLVSGALTSIAPRKYMEAHKQADKHRAVINLAKRRGRVIPESAARIAEWIDDNADGPVPEIVLKWKQLIAATDIRWTGIKDVEKTGIKETGYDLTVPGYETFMSTDGVILSNTMNFHVPISDKAVEQAKQKMLPSKNLFSLTDLKSVMHAPSKEMTMGLYYLTEKPSRKKPKTFRTVKDAKDAYGRGDIGANDPVVILENI